MENYKKLCVVFVLLFFVLVCAMPAPAAEFTKDDLKRWEQEFMASVKRGSELFHSSKLGTNTVSCAQCHPNAANTHPETYPKFQKQIGKVVSLMEMTNWCLQNTLEGIPLEWDDPKMTALQAYMLYERRGVKLTPGRH
jgi:thiosulfate dehydrogenase